MRTTAKQRLQLTQYWAFVNAKKIINIRYMLAIATDFTKQNYMIMRPVRKHTLEAFNCSLGFGSDADQVASQF